MFAKKSTIFLLLCIVLSSSIKLGANPKPKAQTYSQMLMARDNKVNQAAINAQKAAENARKAKALADYNASPKYTKNCGSGTKSYAVFNPKSCGEDFKCAKAAYPAYATKFDVYAVPWECVSKETEIMDPMYNWMKPIQDGMDKFANDSVNLGSKPISAAFKL